MKNLKVNTNSEVKAIFKSFPLSIRKKLMKLRELIIEVAIETDGLDVLEETLKWGEPSYLVKNGSTVRIAWKPAKPDQYGIYFKCTSRLVETFREVFKRTFRYEGNRAILFDINEIIPVAELKSCIRAALKYHTVKKLPDLGLKISRKSGSK